MTRKFFLLQLIFGLPGIIYSTQFQFSPSVILAFVLYALYSTAVVSKALETVISNIEYTPSLSRYYWTVLTIISIASIGVIYFEKAGALVAIFSRDRELRRELFDASLPTLTLYYVLFSSTLLFFYLGALASLLQGVKYIVVGVLVCSLADTITDSRSSVLAFFQGVIAGYFLFFKLDKRLIKLILLVGVAAVPFFFIGQESLDEGVLFLRILSYLSAPPLLALKVSSEIDSPFLQSALELLFWPLQSLIGYKIFDTAYEYLFFQLENGIAGNVLIPSYGCFLDPIETVVFFLVSMACLFFANLISKANKGYALVPAVWLIAIFGPTSLLINPFLAEKGFFLVLLTVLYAIVDRRLYVRFSLYK
jgi:hypothetical protein